MPIEGVDTFSCLCVPDLECAISGAADNYIVSHLGWPHAASVTHQCPQTLKGKGEKSLLSFQWCATHWMERAQALSSHKQTNTPLTTWIFRSVKYCHCLKVSSCSDTVIRIAPITREQKHLRTAGEINFYLWWEGDVLHVPLGGRVRGSINLQNPVS